MTTSDCLDIVINCDLKIRIPATELQEAYGTKETPGVIQSVIRSLQPTENLTQSGAVAQWIQDNDPDFDVLGVQGIWS